MLVLLVTSQAFPDGEDRAELLVAALAEVGVDARWVCWDDPDVAWADADLVAVRATWDYVDRHVQFLAWARAVEAVTPLLNGAQVFAWNSDKLYLVELARAGVDVAPTRAVASAQDVRHAVAEFGEVVLKPRVGAGGVGVRVVGPDDLLGALEVPSVVQPLVPSVRTEGEMSVYVIGGEAVGQVRKVPAVGEIRVHEHLGGRYQRALLDPRLARRAREVAEVAERLVGARITYARVDLLLWDGRWRVSEVELIEPSLYLSLVPENAAALAAAVRRRLS